MTDTDLNYLEKNALWLIMDPWYPHPWKHDVVADPKINERSQAIIEKIVDYLPKLTHVKLSCPSKFPIHPALAHIENYPNETPGSLRADRLITKYMDSHNLTDIVYIGFHLGRCIIRKESGAKMMSYYEKYKLYMKDDLVGRLITDDEEAMLAESAKWLTII